MAVKDNGQPITPVGTGSSTLPASTDSRQARAGTSNEGGGTPDLEQIYARHLQEGPSGLGDEPSKTTESVDSRWEAAGSSSGGSRTPDLEQIYAQHFPADLSESGNQIPSRVALGQSEQLATSEAEALSFPKADVAEKTPRKPRPDRSHISTVEELLAAREKPDMKKMALGEGLEAHFHEDGFIKFFYRLGGKGGTDITLGDSRSMSIKEAREQAKLYRATVLSEREKIRVQKLKERSRSISASRTKIKSSKPAIPKASSLKSMADIGRFVRALRQGAGIEDDVASLIHLLVLTPVEAEELIAAQRGDIRVFLPRIVDGLQWRINTSKPDRYGYFIVTKAAFLSVEAQEVIQGIPLGPLGEEASKYLFPRLAALPKSAALKEIAEGVNRIGSRANCTIEPSGFREIFKEVACGQSYFSSPLVDAAMLNDPGNQEDETYYSYVYQAHQLADWWALMVTASADAQSQSGPQRDGPLGRNR